MPVATAMVSLSPCARRARRLMEIDAGAVKFYRHFGFVSFPAIASRLFLPMKAVAGLFR
jgi:hypothetical protein